MTPKTTKQGLSRFILLINYYHNMWAIMSHVFQYLTKLITERVNFKYKDFEQKAFNEIKQEIMCADLL